MNGPLGAKNKSKMAATERILKWLFPFALLMGSTKSLPDVIKIGKTYCFWSMLNTQISCNHPLKDTKDKVETFFVLIFWTISCSYNAAWPHRFAKSSFYFWPIIRFSVFPAQFWIFSKWCLVLSLGTLFTEIRQILAKFIFF